jgi:hypothetical protein
MLPAMRNPEPVSCQRRRYMTIPWPDCVATLWQGFLSITDDGLRSPAGARVRLS